MTWLIAQGNLIDTGIVNLIGAIGSAGAAVAVLWICINYIRDQQDRSEKQMDRLFTQFAELSKDKGVVLRENAIIMTKLVNSMDNLTGAIEHTDRDPRPDRQEK